MTITSVISERRNGTGALNTGHLLRSILAPAALALSVAMAGPVHSAPLAYLHLPEPQLLALAPAGLGG